MKKSLLLGISLIVLLLIANTAMAQEQKPKLKQLPKKIVDIRTPEYCEASRLLKEGQSTTCVGQMIIPKTPLEGKYEVTLEKVLSENEVEISINDAKNVTFELKKQKEVEVSVGKKRVKVVLEVLGIDFSTKYAWFCLFEPPETKKILACEGCIADGNCFPVGTRMILQNVPKFCSVEKEWVEQKKKGESCSNNYECASNLCVDGKCVEKSLLQLFVEWFMTILRTLGLVR